MQDFCFDWKTKIIFGTKAQDKILEEAKPFGKKVLLHYGSERITKTALYKKLLDDLKGYAEVSILPGVVPNPRLELVEKGVKICKDKDIDLVLGIGGGSVIDSAKAIALGAHYAGKVWDFFEGGGQVDEVLPIGAIITLAGSGSEASKYTVITNEEESLKNGFGDDRIRPRFAIMNPEWTHTVPAYHTACGVADILSHILERYFGQIDHSDINDPFIEVTIKTVMENAFQLQKNPYDYIARSEILWASTIAQNDFMGLGRVSDFEMHKIEHELSALYDIAHGAGLAIIMPAWMQYVYKHDVQRFQRLFSSIWKDYETGDHLERSILQGIERFKAFFKKIHLPVSLKEVHISDEKFDMIARRCTKNGPVGKLKPLGSEDIKNILLLAS